MLLKVEGKGMKYFYLSPLASSPYPSPLSCKLNTEESHIACERLF
jgi:hypothetical protein